MSDLRNILSVIATAGRIEGDELAELHDALYDDGQDDVAETLSDLFGQCHPADVMCGTLWRLSHSELTLADAATWPADEDDERESEGYHGLQKPPSDADYIGVDTETDEYIAIHPSQGSAIGLSPGWCALRWEAKPGAWEHDGTFKFVVIGHTDDGRAVIVCS